MAQVIVRNIEDEVVERLKLKAQLNGRPLEQELRDILRKAAPLTVEDKIALVTRAHERTSKRTQSILSEDIVREDRER